MRSEVKRSGLEGLADHLRTLPLALYGHRELLKGSGQRTDVIQHRVLEGIPLVAGLRRYCQEGG